MVGGTRVVKNTFVELADDVDNPDSTPGLVVKNTFLELANDLPRIPLRRSNSESGLSSLSTPSLQELKTFSTSCSTYSSGSTVGSSADSGTITPDLEDALVERYTPSIEAVELYDKLVNLAGSRNLSSKIEDSLDRNQIRNLIPKDAKGNVTSIGSIVHYKEEIGKQCRPCVFWLKNKCEKGDVCLHCHVKHYMKHKRLRASKSTRERRAKAFQNAKGDIEAVDGEDTSQDQSVDPEQSADLDPGTASGSSVSVVPSVDARSPMTKEEKPSTWNKGTRVSL